MPNVVLLGSLSISYNYKIRIVGERLLHQKYYSLGEFFGHTLGVLVYLSPTNLPVMEKWFGVCISRHLDNGFFGKRA